jgi:4-diphosphocytidyl-2-C-methyl-D-erythritol kinase
VRFTTLAPAKVNLVLRVGPRRADGYHDLLTLMAPLDLGDRVDVRISPRPGDVRCDVPGRPELCGASNLAARAAAAFRERFGIANGIAIRIDKRTPVTAGLGGGSSDAAAAIRCLKRAFRVRDDRALREIALAVGSDVPFFLGPGPAWATGRGERLRPADVPTLDLVLGFPEDPALAIRAGEAYAWLDEARQNGAPARPLGRPGRFSPSRAGNDLEAPCLDRRPALVPLLGLLRAASARVAMISGSGPTVFGVFSGRGAALAAALTIGRDEASRRSRTFVVRTARRQPRVTPWRSPRSASSLSTRRSSRRT